MLSEVFQFLFLLKRVAVLGFRKQSASAIYSNLQRLLEQLKQPVSSEISFPPHSISLYRDFLSALKQSNQCTFLNLHELLTGKPIDPERINVMLRHDLDAGNPDVAYALCNTDRQMGLPFTVHILVDGLCYDPSIMKDLAKEFHGSGSDVGLHTQAYMTTDPVAAFRKDLFLFENYFGFSPKTFTFHGVYPRTNDGVKRRMQMVKNMDKLLKNTSIEGYMNTFDWLSHDSNVNGQKQPIRNNFYDLEARCFLGGTALVLTHDNFWQNP